MIIDSRSLREQVYDFIREQLTQGKLIPGQAINLNALSQELGISKTPLRDALLQLDTEGFVTISPRRGIYVNRLTLENIRHCYEIIGALETAVLMSVFEKIEGFHLDKMKRINQMLRSAIRREDFHAYYQGNIRFHEVFLALSDNLPLKRIIVPLKQRLYDFPRRGYIAQWELDNCDHHDRLIETLEKGDRQAARKIWREVHWSYEAQEGYIRRFYAPDSGDDAAGPGEDAALHPLNRSRRSRRR